MNSVVEGNDVEQCLHLFNVLSRKREMLVCFDGAVGKVQIYSKLSPKYKVVKRQRKLFSIFDPSKDGRNIEEVQTAKRWYQAASILSREMKDRGIVIRILPDDQCIFARLFEKAHVPIVEIAEKVASGEISPEYAAEIAGMSMDSLRIALKHATGMELGEDDYEKYGEPEGPPA
jgi:hypothetical protein